VNQFLESFLTWRDLSIVSLMLLCGLRSREVLGLLLEDVDLSCGEVRVRGKGDKERIVPLAPQSIPPLQAYLAVERPEAAVANLFVCLKGWRRGSALTPAGLRSLFRYHRKRSKVSKANPHRFRHTFGADMARAGISIPALMQLMGHAHIHTTMIYVELSAHDVRDEFQRVLAKIRKKSP
jgi:site-specific recombinase XerD